MRTAGQVDTDGWAAREKRKAASTCALGPPGAQPRVAPASPRACTRPARAAGEPRASLGRPVSEKQGHPGRWEAGARGDGQGGVSAVGAGQVHRSLRRVSRGRPESRAVCSGAKGRALV